MKLENLEMFTRKLDFIDRYLLQHDRYVLMLNKTGNPKVNDLAITIRHPQFIKYNAEDFIQLHHSFEICYNDIPIMFIVYDNIYDMNIAISIFPKFYKNKNLRKSYFENIIINPDNLDDEALKNKILLPVMVSGCTLLTQIEKISCKDYDVKILMILKNIRNIKDIG